MTTLSDFTPEELKTIQLAPMLVLGAATVSEPGGPLSIAKEMVAGMNGLLQSLNQNPSQLVQDIFKSLEKADFNDEEKSEMKTAEARQQLIDKSLPAARSAYDLIAEKSNEDDAKAFAQALLNGAEAAVHAAKTGSFLGFGGTQVTESEAAYVKSLADTLGFRTA
jgi:hypothetical protein